MFSSVDRRCQELFLEVPRERSEFIETDNIDTHFFFFFVEWVIFYGECQPFGEDVWP